jgi:hypothetical protein
MPVALAAALSFVSGILYILDARRQIRLGSSGK